MEKVRYIPSLRGSKQKHDRTTKTQRTQRSLLIIIILALLSVLHQRHCAFVVHKFYFTIKKSIHIIDIGT
jgi:hypothetical protein